MHSAISDRSATKDRRCLYNEGSIVSSFKGITMLSDAQVDRATRENTQYAHSLGWGTKVVQIAKFLDVPTTAASDRKLAQNVERFQSARPPLQKDGIIGPQTWPLLQKSIDESLWRPSDNPDAPPPKSSAPNTERIKALDDWLLSITDGHPQSKVHWTFYEEIDGYLGPFGDNGYPIAYGKKYCVLFNGDAAINRDPQGKAWIRRTTILLQTALRGFIVKRYQEGTLGQLTEPELRDAAFASHPLAYTQGGLTLVVMLSPHLLPVIASIPAAEFVGANAAASWVQAIETGGMVLPELAGMTLAGLAGPAHTGLFARAAERDRQEFQRRVQMSTYLGALKQAIQGGKLDRVAWLNRATREVNSTEYPDASMVRFAAEVVAAADARKRTLAERYRREIAFTPELRSAIDSYDPGWNQW
jgi:hypothetical protein